MAKPRVHEIAKEIGITSKELLKKLTEMGEYVSSASSTLEAPVVRRVREAYAPKAETTVAKPAAPKPSPTKPTPRPAGGKDKTPSEPVASKPVATPGAPTPTAPPSPAESARPVPKPSPGRPSPKPGASRTGAAAPKQSAPRPGATPRPGGNKPAPKDGPGPRPGARPGPRPGGSAPTPGSHARRPGTPRPGNNPFAASQGMGVGRPGAQRRDTGSRQGGDQRMPRPGGTGGLPRPNPAMMPKTQNSTLGQAAVRGSGRSGGSGRGRPGSQGRPGSGGFGGPPMGGPASGAGRGGGRGRGGGTQGAFGRGGAGGRRGRKSKKQRRQEFDQMEAPTIGGVRLRKGDGQTVRLRRGASLTDLAEKIGVEPAALVQVLFHLGEMVTATQSVADDTLEVLGAELDYNIEVVSPEDEDRELLESFDLEFGENIGSEEDLRARPPVVTVMGHVDHGKTSLLDAIRNTSVSTHEAGGITQHIGAYQVVCQGKKIVFLDTPGHEAFTAMRARGAQITDVAILVVAADDGVMPQTVEAIDHAKSAGVPIIIAINKIDKPGANPDRVKQELMEYGLVSEEYGGDTIMVPVSAKQRIGIDDLLENILLVAEVEELKANPNREARGVIIEAKLDKGRGSVATVLVQSGTLRIGDSIVVGTAYGHVRAMINDRGDNVKKAGPSMPVEILGLNDVPSAGDILAAVDEKQARSIAEARLGNQRRDLIKSKSVSLDALFQQIQQGDIKDLNIVVKADVQGSVEALNSALLGLNKNDEVRVSIVHSGVGAVSESDIMLATASKAIVIAFNVRPDANARRLADTEDVDIRTYRVIYDALNDVKDAMSGMLKPKYKEVIQGRVEIRQVMRFSKALVAGSYVLEGKIHNNSKIRILRDNVELFDGEIDSLRRFKDEVKEVAAGYECGISIVDFRDFTEGDIIEAYTMEEIETSIAEANKAAEQKREAQAAAAAAAAAAEENAE